MHFLLFNYFKSLCRGGNTLVLITFITDSNFSWDKLYCQYVLNSTISLEISRLKTTTSVCSLLPYKRSRSQQPLLNGAWRKTILFSESIGFVCVTAAPMANEILHNAGRRADWQRPPKGAGDTEIWGNSNPFLCWDTVLHVALFWLFPQHQFLGLREIRLLEPADSVGICPFVSAGSGFLSRYLMCRVGNRTALLTVGV